MKIFPDLHAYNNIQDDVTLNLPRYIKKSPLDINNILVVGAYHGYEIDKFLSLYRNAKILAFEPFPKNFNILQSRFKSEPRVKCLQYACSDFIGESEFHELNAEGNGSLLKVNEGSAYKLKEVETVKVKTVTLESIIGTSSIDLLWMDVQGNKSNVLKGYPNKNFVLSMFLEIQVKEGFNHDSYIGNCYFENLQEQLKVTHSCHSIGLDNELKNGTGNSFWLRNDLNV